MVAGGVGAGKSTYSRKLQSSLPAIRFSIDEWMVPLFSEDQPSVPDYQWAITRVDRCEYIMKNMAIQNLKNNCDVIFDLGFIEKERRMLFYEWIKKTGYLLELHFIDISSEERWDRVQKRNQDKGETFSLTVTKEMFNFCEGIYKKPTKEEIKGLGIILSPKNL